MFTALSMPDEFKSNKCPIGCSQQKIQGNGGGGRRQAAAVMRTINNRVVRPSDQTVLQNAQTRYSTVDTLSHVQQRQHSNGFFSIDAIDGKVA